MSSAYEMLRAQCRSGQLTRAVHSVRVQGFNGSVVERQSFCTHQTRMTDQSKRNTNSHKSRKEDSDHEKKVKWNSFFKSEVVRNDIGAGESNAGGTGDFKGAKNAGTWTSLRSRMQASGQEEPIENAQPTEAGKDASSTTEEGPSPSDSVTTKKAAGSKSKRKAKAQLEVKTIRPARLKLKPVEEQLTQQAPELCYNLDRVLFNPGVYHMQDHRSGVFNFDPYLASIMPVEEFDFDALKEYITSSKDAKLRDLCVEHGLKYCGSTSSMTSILSHFHFLLSAWRKPNFDNLSKSLNPESVNFTLLSRGPAAAFAHFKDGVYAIDADKEYDTENILSMLGKSMEKLLTLPKEEFEKYRRSRSHQLSAEEKNADETYHFTTLGDFLMRSQLDAYDPRLPGSGVFDLKTRAVVSIRMDVKGYEKGVGYEIRKRFGQWESFEREYYDMIRAAFLKYSLQVRMGRMDGIFVAFHNTQRIFGFQYISLAEMDQAIHGTNETRLGDEEFKCSVSLLNDLMNRATQRFPGRTLRLHVETRPTKVPLTYFFVEPVTEEEMHKTQEAGKLSVEQLEREIQDLSREERDAETAQEAEAAQRARANAEESDKAAYDLPINDTQSEGTWKEMMSKVDEAVENESLGVRSIREAVQEALEQSGLLQDKTELESEKYLDDLVSALTAHSSEAREVRESQTSGGEEIGSQKEAATRSDSNDTTLANLILRVTEGINEKSPNLRTFERKVADLAAQAKKPETRSAGETGETAANGNTNNNVGDLEELDFTVDEAQKDPSASEGPKRELLGMYISIRNRVNGEFVERPLGSDKAMDWAVQYTITELSDKRAQRIYAKIKKRRKEVLATDPRARSADWYRMFKGQLPIVTKQGEKFRAKRREQEAGRSVHVAWDREPIPPNNYSENG
ncbi:hypothetical protein QQS21_004332 [Conoideocrella luteorostrata]|uniref:Pet127-domain-containing protein n=1 Tax=Conoideocrella luteorostrata TaxID=1105319 RepID=A0AAJ0CRN5_9HYPO|nr:hypothetical protein QQS21_004332 [Conoideocrella luteorostrata]